MWPRATSRRAVFRFGLRRSVIRRRAQEHGRGRNGRARSRSLGPIPHSPLLVDSLFGTGLKRGLEASVYAELSRLHRASVVSVACDVPSGVDSDSGAELSPVPGFDLTVTFGALKPAHRLFPASHKCGRVVLADIGIDAAGTWHEIAPPNLPALDPGGHKYDRGLVHALAGAMPGAIALAAKAAARAGAGYVRVSTSRTIDGLPSAIVQTDTAQVDDPRIGCLLVGPGLGDLPKVLTLALTSKAPKVIDADGITQLGDPGRTRGQDAILTPHEGEFRKLFCELPGTSPSGHWKERRDRARSSSTRARTLWLHRLTADWASRRRPRPGWRARGPVMFCRGSSPRFGQGDYRPSKQPARVCGCMGAQRRLPARP